MSKVKNFIRGDSRTINVTVTNADGTPKDITGGKVMFTLKPTDDTADDTAASVSKTVTSHTSPTLGLSAVTLLPTDTSGLTVGTYYYDLQVVDASGNVTSTKQDTWQIIADTTRRTT